MINVPIKLLTKTALLPEQHSEGAAGYDLHFDGDGAAIFEPGAKGVLETGISLAIPPGLAGYVLPRSGLACKNGLTVTNAPGLIDSDYRGEVKVCLINLGVKKCTVLPGDRIAQLVILPALATDFVITEELEATERGDGGLGSTGEK